MQHQDREIVSVWREVVEREVDRGSSDVPQRDVAEFVGDGSFPCMDPRCVAHFVVIGMPDPLPEHSGRQVDAFADHQGAPAVACEGIGHTYQRSSFVTLRDAEQVIDGACHFCLVCHFQAS
ncbi:hypothetical protein [Rhodococcus olei]|uniref:hypothetical protein n=1 Tax=Rhodococcus olei TaxID=2161675 RepID=UPI0031E92479